MLSSAMNDVVSSMLPSLETELLDCPMSKSPLHQSWLKETVVTSLKEAHPSVSIWNADWVMANAGLTETKTPTTAISNLFILPPKFLGI